MKFAIFSNRNVWKDWPPRRREWWKNAGLSLGEAKIYGMGGGKGTSKDENKGWPVISWQNQESKIKIMEAKTGSFNKTAIKSIKY